MYIRSVNDAGSAGRSAIHGLLFLGVLSIACGAEKGSPPLGSGGAGAGGAPSGGVPSGGTPSGGSPSGGAAAGGAVSGGMGGSTSIGGLSSIGGISAGGTVGSGGKAGSGGQSSGGTSAGSGGTSAGSGGGGGSGGSSSTGKSAGCGATRKLTNGNKTISSGGMNRQYILRAPDNYDNNKPYRLIMAYHWRSGNAKQVAEGGNGGSTEDPFYGLWDLAQNSTIFVAPEGLDAGWANTGDRDINLTDAILKEVSADLCIDTSRIFATGFSYGAGMSFALACARADVFRGVALYAGAQLSGCTGGTKPIAYFHAHGVGDSVLNISQGRQLRDKYVGVNGCTAQNPPEPAKNSGMHTCTSYQGCSEGHPVRWCAHGGDHNPTEKDSGQSKSWVPGEAWTFISQF